MRTILALSIAAGLTAAPLQDALRLVVEPDPASGDALSEFVRLHNESPQPISLDGYRLCDAIGTCFLFGSGSTLAAGDSITIVTGRGTNGPGLLHWGRGVAVWNNTGDVALLLDTNGQEVTRHGYGSQPDVRMPGQAAPRAAPRPATPPPRRTCCRVCTTGKACGNSCISRSYTCRQPPGCACNGGDDEFAAAILSQLQVAEPANSWPGLEPTSFLCRGPDEVGGA